MSRYFIYLKYKGSKYHGWQIQPNANTVQQVLEEKLSILLREKIETTGAGRTDTGVHAKEFVAHFNTNSILTKNKSHFLFKINCLLPHDVSVYNIIEVKPEAHARFDAVSRKYEYHLVSSKDPFKTEFAYYYPWNLKIDLMMEACEKLVGYADFTSFSKLHTDVKTNFCVISEAIWKQEDDRIVFAITADRFLRNMVRAIVGTVLEVGREKLSVTEFAKIILAKNRSLAGISSPAHGLFLSQIIYPASIFKE